MGEPTPSIRDCTTLRANVECFSPCSMFFNSVQNFETWKLYFKDPQGSKLGLLGALYQIGSLVSIPIV